MDRRALEQKIAADLELCDLVSVIGNKKAKRAARRQRKICLKQIQDWNAEDDLSELSDDELLSALSDA